MHSSIKKMGSLVALVLLTVALLLFAGAPAWGSGPMDEPPSGSGSGTSGGSGSDPAGGHSGSGSDGASGSQGDGTSGGSGSSGDTSGSHSGQPGSTGGGPKPSTSSGPTTQFQPNDDTPSGSSSTSAKPKPNPKPAENFGNGSDGAASSAGGTINLSAGSEPDPAVTGSGTPVSNEEPEGSKSGNVPVAGALAAGAVALGATATKPRASKKACEALIARRNGLLSKIAAREKELRALMLQAHDNPTFDENLPGPTYAAWVEELALLNGRAGPVWEELNQVNSELAESGCL